MDPNKGYEPATVIATVVSPGLAKKTYELLKVERPGTIIPDRMWTILVSMPEMYGSDNELRVFHSKQDCFRHMARIIGRYPQDHFDVYTDDEYLRNWYWCRARAIIDGEFGADMKYHYQKEWNDEGRAGMFDDWLAYRLEEEDVV